MDNNDGTPNPLNPNPATNPEQNGNLDVMGQADQFDELDSTNQTEQPGDAEQIDQPMQPSQPAQPGKPIAGAKVASETVMIDSLDPTGRQMEKVVPIEPEEKKKKGPIIAIISIIVVLILGVVAAIVLAIVMNKPDPVATAIQRIVNGETPKNIAIDGSIDFLVKDTSLPVERMKLTIDSDLMTGTAVNASSATLNIETRNNGSFSIELEEVYGTDGDIFFKLDGITEAIEEYDLLNLFTSTSNTITDCSDSPADTDCEIMIECESEVPEDCLMAEEQTAATTDEAILQATTETSAGETLLSDSQAALTEGATEELTGELTSEANPLLDAVIAIVKTVDGYWLRISTEDLTSLSPELVADNPASCVVNIFNDVNSSSNATAVLYNKYPFIGTIEKGTKPASKNSPVRIVSFDAANLTSFVNSIQSQNLKEDLFSCLGWRTDRVIEKVDIEAILSKIPTLYTEINGDNDFSRLYFETEFGEGTGTMIVDLDFTYPVNINVSEPVEYTDLSDAIQVIMSSLNLEVTEGEIQEGAETTEGTEPVLP